MSLALLADYDSGSGSEPEAPPPPVRREQRAKKKKKRRRVDSAKLLPAHLQRALETGLLASDDEGEASEAATAGAARAFRLRASGKGLLAALPAPTQGEGAKATLPAPRRRPEGHARAAKAAEEADGKVVAEEDQASPSESEDSDVSDDDLPFALRAPQETQAPPAAMPLPPSLYRTAEETARDMMDAEGESMRPQQRREASAALPVLGGIPPPAPPPGPPPPGPPPSRAPEVSAPGPSAEDHSAAGPPHGAYASYPEAAAAAFAFAPPSPPTRKRRRGDEAIAAALQSGNAADLERLTGGTQTWQTHNPASWDPHGAGATGNPIREVKVATSFYGRGAGGLVSTDAPLRVHRQKHQINQLATDALRMEADLLERRSRGIKTKAQTAAKYGW